MDKDAIRIIILLLGLLVIAGMIAWSFFKHERARKEFDEFEAQNDNDAHSPISEMNFNEGFDIANSDHQSTENISSENNKDIETPPNFKTNKQLDDPISKQANSTSKIEIPEILKFSILAKTEEGFNGSDVYHALKDVGLEYGSLQIFERLDDNRLVDFGVLSMVKPGTFPKDDLDSFYMPGIVFFMQPSEVDDPIAVFEDFIRTINFVAIKLDGEMLDHNQELLNNDTIQAIRYSL